MFPLPSSVAWMFLFVCLVVSRISPDFNRICWKVQLWVNQQQVICFWFGSGADPEMFWHILRSAFVKSSYLIIILHVLTKMYSKCHLDLPYGWLNMIKKAFYAFRICRKTQYHALQQSFSVKEKVLVDFLYSFIHCFIHPPIFTKSQASCFPCLLPYRHFYPQLKQTCHLSVGL